MSSEDDHVSDSESGSEHASSEADDFVTPYVGPSPELLSRFFNSAASHGRDTEMSTDYFEREPYSSEDDSASEQSDMDNTSAHSQESVGLEEELDSALTSPPTATAPSVVQSIESAANMITDATPSPEETPIKSAPVDDASDTGSDSGDPDSPEPESEEQQTGDTVDHDPDDSLPEQSEAADHGHDAYESDTSVVQDPEPPRKKQKKSRKTNNADVITTADLTAEQREHMALHEKAKRYVPRETMTGKNRRWVGVVNPNMKVANVSKQTHFIWFKAHRGIVVRTILYLWRAQAGGVYDDYQLQINGDFPSERTIMDELNFYNDEFVVFKPTMCVSLDDE